MFDMKACVQRFLGDACKVSLLADIWTKKGLCHPTSVYLHTFSHAVTVDVIK